MTILGQHYPDDLYYHALFMVWLRRDADELLTLGLTPLARASAGEILLFAPKAVGWQIARDRAVGNVETGKIVASVRTPVAGVLVAVNSPLERGALAINTAPFDTWLVRLKPTDWVNDKRNVLTGLAAQRAFEEQIVQLNLDRDRPDVRAD
jgi:glycine cleavage system H protein